MDRIRAWVRAPVGIVAAGALLLTIATVALDVTGVVGLRPFGPLSALDYSAPPFGGFYPLRAPYVSSVLGERIAPPTPSAAGHGGFHASPPVAVSHALTNDAVAQAYEIESVPFTARTDSAQATRESSDPRSCAGEGTTVWYRYVATGDVTLIGTTSADYPVTLGAFIVPVERSSEALVCDKDDGGQSRVVFSAFAGTTYLFQITGLPAGGRLVFSLEPALKSSPISVLPDGQYAGANYDYGYPKLSADGRSVVFESNSTELDPRCAKHADGSRPCGESQVFRNDLKTGMTELVSLTSSGGVPSDASYAPWVSGDGRYVTFSTRAANVTSDVDRPDLTVGDRENDVFRRDLLLGVTERVTLDVDGHELNGGDGSISDDGRFIAFVGDFEHRITAQRQGAGVQDVYIKDMVTGAVTLASVGNRGERGNHDSITPQISPDGYYVAFWTRATTLSDGPLPTDDLQNLAGIFQGRVYVYDNHRRHLSFECVPESGRVSNDHCFGPSISRDGRYSLFWSDATDLLPGVPSGGTFLHPIVNLYLRDRLTGSLELMNVTDGGTPVGERGERQLIGVAATRLFRPWISADGSIVAFDSESALAPGDRDGIVDAYVRDRTRGRTIRVSETPAGTGGDDRSIYPYPSGDGTMVAFLSLARNLATPEGDSDWDMFVCRWRPS